MSVAALIIVCYEQGVLSKKNSYATHFGHLTSEKDGVCKIYISGFGELNRTMFLKFYYIPLSIQLNGQPWEYFVSTFPPGIFHPFLIFPLICFPSPRIVPLTTGRIPHCWQGEMPGKNPPPPPRKDWGGGGGELTD